MILLMILILLFMVITLAIGTAALVSLFGVSGMFMMLAPAIVEIMIAILIIKLFYNKKNNE